MKQYRWLIWENLPGVLGTAVLILLESLSMTIAGYSLSFFFTAYQYAGDKVRALIYTLGIVSAIWIIAMLLYYLALLAQAKMQQKLKNDLRAMIGTKIGSLSYADFTSRDSGHYVSWLTNDVDQIYSQSFAALFSGVECLTTAAFSLGALVLLSRWIGLSAIALLAVISVLPQFANRPLQKANAKRSQALETATEAYKDVVMGGAVFFLSNLRDRIRERIRTASETAEQVCFRYQRTNTTVQIGIQTVSMLGQVLLLFVTLLAAVFGAADASALLSVGNLAGSFFNGAGSLVQCFLTVKASVPLWEKFERDDTQKEPSKGELETIPEIRLENVSFRYREQPVLEHQNCTFQAGGKYAVMGESGSGKTTLTKIILGLLPGYRGKVLYGGREQRDLRTDSLYEHIAYVDQEVYLFQDTLRFNVALGEPYRDEEILAVLRKCRLEAYLHTLPDGLDTVIQENGKNLSGGQRQRIALARSLIRQVQYIILDEGTSALDERNAVEIERDLVEDPNLGVILVTHNLRDAIREKLTEVYSLG